MPMQALLLVALLCLRPASTSYHGAPLSSTSVVEIAPGVHMPAINLGTCCGSDPRVGVRPWLLAGGRGIDTAYDYQDQRDIRAVLQKGWAKNKYPKRDKLFITSKIPAGFGSAADCAVDPGVALRYVQKNLKQLGVKYIDLLLIHHPCRSAEANNALWQGLVQARNKGWVKAIGVSNFNADQLRALKGPIPAVNQCRMGVKHHDEETINYCHQQGIAYEAWGVMRECPFHSPVLQDIAKKGGVSVAEVCISYVLQRGCLMAMGTGKDPRKAARETRMDMLQGHSGFRLSSDQLLTLSTGGYEQSPLAQMQSWMQKHQGKKHGHSGSGSDDSSGSNGSGRSSGSGSSSAAGKGGGVPLSHHVHAFVHKHKSHIMIFAGVALGMWLLPAVGLAPYAFARDRSSGATAMGDFDLVKQYAFQESPLNKKYNSVKENVGIDSPTARQITGEPASSKMMRRDNDGEYGSHSIEGIV